MNDGCAWALIAFGVLLGMSLLLIGVVAYELQP